MRAISFSQIIVAYSLELVGASLVDTAMLLAGGGERGGKACG